MTDAEIARLAELSASVPAGGVIVEVGCLYGLSSWHISQHCRPGVTVFCIDPWQREQWIIDAVEVPQGALPFGRSAFEEYTKDCSNIVMIQGFSPDVAKGWKLPIDLYVEDAMHTNPILAANIAFWSQLVKPGGVVSGHDYTPIWPDVMMEAEALALRFESKVERVETFWSVTKPVRTLAN